MKPDLINWVISDTKTKACPFNRPSYICSRKKTIRHLLFCLRALWSHFNLKWKETQFDLTSFSVNHGYNTLHFRRPFLLYSFKVSLKSIKHLRHALGCFCDVQRTRRLHFKVSREGDTFQPGATATIKTQALAWSCLRKRNDLGVFRTSDVTMT